MLQVFRCISAYSGSLLRLWCQGVRVAPFRTAEGRRGVAEITSGAVSLPHVPRKRWRLATCYQFRALASYPMPISAHSRRRCALSISIRLNVHSNGYGYKRMCLSKSDCEMENPPRWRCRSGSAPLDSCTPSWMLACGRRLSLGENSGFVGLYSRKHNCGIKKAGGPSSKNRPPRGSEGKVSRSDEHRPPRNVNTG